MGTPLMPSWVYGVGLGIFAVAGCVWGLMLFGAYVTSLAAPPKRLKPFALQPEYSKPVMKAMVRELVFFISAFAMAIGAFLNQESIKERTEAVVAGLLSQVRGESSPQGLLDALQPLAEVPTDLQPTARAYLEYLRHVGKGATPDIDLITRLVPAERNAFDERLLGLAHDYFAERMSPKVGELQRDHFGKAREHYQAALAAMRASGKQFDPKLQSAFEARTRSNLAGVTLSFALLEKPGSKERQDMLLAAAKEYAYLKGTLGSVASHLNLAACYSELGLYDSKYFEMAITVLSDLQKSRLLSADDKKEARTRARDLEQMHELRPLADYVKRRNGITWDKFVGGLFP